AARRAMARPIPRLAPVMNSVRPLRPVDAGAGDGGMSKPLFRALGFIPCNYEPIARKIGVPAEGTVTFGEYSYFRQVTDLGGLWCGAGTESTPLDGYTIHLHHHARFGPSLRERSVRHGRAASREPP